MTTDRVRLERQERSWYFHLESITQKIVFHQSSIVQWLVKKFHDEIHPAVFQNNYMMETVFADVFRLKLRLCSEISFVEFIYIYIYILFWICSFFCRVLLDVIV